MPAGQERAEAVAVGDRRGDAEDHDQRVEQEQRHRAHEAELLGERGEDEVGVLFGQEVQPGLGALHEAAPREAARAERDLGLGDVVAGAERVGVGVEEGEDAGELVFLDELPVGAVRLDDRGDEADAAGGGGGEVPEADAGEEHHHPGAGEEQDRGAEVGLLEDEGDRQGGQHQGQDEPERAGDLGRVEAVVVGGERHDERDLHQLGRLELDRAEVDPALGAHADLAHHLDEDEECERAGIGERRHRSPEADVDDGDAEHAADADGEAEHLRSGPGIGGAAGDRVEHEKAGAATAPRRSTSAQLIARSLAAPCGVPRPVASKAVMRGPSRAGLRRRRGAAARCSSIALRWSAG